MIVGSSKTVASKQVGNYTVARADRKLSNSNRHHRNARPEQRVAAGGITAFSQNWVLRTRGSHFGAPAHPLMKRIVMTAPRAPQWPLTPALRLAALALLFVGCAMITYGWLSFLLWFIAVVLLVFAAIQLAKNWSGRRLR